MSCIRDRRGGRVKPVPFSANLLNIATANLALEQKCKGACAMRTSSVLIINADKNERGPTAEEFIYAMHS